MPDPETARSVLERLFFSDKKYDLGEVGRYRLNKRLKLDVDLDTRYLTKEDIVAIVKEVIRLKELKSHVEDRKSTRLNSSHVATSYAVFCSKKKTTLLDLFF